MLLRLIMVGLAFAGFGMALGAIGYAGVALFLMVIQWAQ